MTKNNFVFASKTYVFSQKYCASNRNFAFACKALKYSFSGKREGILRDQEQDSKAS